MQKLTKQVVLNTRYNEVYYYEVVMNAYIYRI